MDRRIRFRRFIHPVKTEFKDNAMRLRVLHGHQSAVGVRDASDNTEPKSEPRWVSRVTRLGKPPEIFVIQFRARVLNREEHILIDRPDGHLKRPAGFRFHRAGGVLHQVNEEDLKLQRVSRNHRARHRGNEELRRILPVFLIVTEIFHRGGDDRCEIHGLMRGLLFPRVPADPVHDIRHPVRLAVHGVRRFFKRRVRGREVFKRQTHHLAVIHDRRERLLQFMRDHAREMRNEGIAFQHRELRSRFAFVLGEPFVVRKRCREVACPLPNEGPQPHLVHHEDEDQKSDTGENPPVLDEDILECQWLRGKRPHPERFIEVAHGV